MPDWIVYRPPGCGLHLRRAVSMPTTSDCLWSAAGTGRFTAAGTTLGVRDSIRDGVGDGVGDGAGGGVGDGAGDGVGRGGAERDGAVHGHSKINCASGTARADCLAAPAVLQFQDDQYSTQRYSLETLQNIATTSISRSGTFSLFANQLHRRSISDEARR